MRRTPAALFGLAGLGLFALPTVAQDRSPQEVATRTAQYLDADRDGVVSQAEFLNKHPDPELWRKLDRNKDGALDADEQKQAFTPKYQVRP